MKSAMNRREFGARALVASAALAATGSAALGQSAPVKIRVGWVVVPASIAPLVLAKKDLLTHFGHSYVAETTRFEGTPPVITALASGELDIGPLAFSSFALAIENAHMDDLRVICDEIEDGVPGHGTNEFMVLKDGPIKTVADLRGKVLATNVMGSAVDIAMRVMLRRSGLEANKDYTVIEAPFPAMRAMLAERKADLISAVPPFAFDPDLRAMGNTLFTQKDALGITQLTMWTARTDFIQKNRAALVDFLEDTVRAVRWFTDPKNHAEAVAIVARLNKAPTARMDWAFTNRDQYRDPNGMPNLKALQTNLQLQKQVGFLKSNIDVNKYSDLGLVEEAANRLK
ncbi:MAG TPA: ABC transporter substrate-binding protein [Xanthobacteraceae bacterium]